MSSFLQTSSRLRAPLSSIPLSRPAVDLTSRRFYVQGTPKKYGQANQKEPTENPELDNTPNHPIPSNKAHPTLGDGRQSNLTDEKGKPNKNLPEDVKKHNAEMENRYDKPYNHIADEGPVESAFEKK
ncbi:hypothetical protein N7478_003278 [Penicillium angulare]|uniref:uncharacterized protein n=1 Tax=Penicillium angulare TaxID=116970 RepID=UPI002540F445|nr:uncharacterized protein N7478_003278 [Penicillium angulare]KAJ5287592.1 hypothetical protein N7478_003278 [Penicillium angulare]